MSRFNVNYCYLILFLELIEALITNLQLKNNSRKIHRTSKTALSYIH